ncbi:MAG: phosphatase PAP2 family protein, partial [Muribaculaceae bacterium]
MGGFTAFVYLLYHSQLLIFGGMTMLYAAVIITGLVGTSRVALGLHTPMQVIAGVANGAVCIILLSLFY